MIYGLRGEYELSEAVPVLRQGGDLTGTGEALIVLGSALCQNGDRETGREAWQEAYELLCRARR